MGGAAAAAVYDDVSGGRLWFRRRDPAAPPAWNVVAEAGTRTRERTVVLIAHHDAAHCGLVFHPALPRIAMRLMPALHARAEPEHADHLRRVPRPAAAGALGTARAAGSCAVPVSSSRSARPPRWRTSAPARSCRAPTTTSARWRALVALAHALRERPPRGGARDPALHGRRGGLHGGHAGVRAAPLRASSRATRPSSSASNAWARPSCAWSRARGCSACATTPEASREALARAGEAAGRRAAPRPAHGCGHRRADRAARRLPHLPTGRRGRDEVPGRTTTGRRTCRTTSTGSRSRARSRCAEAIGAQVAPPVGASSNSGRSRMPSRVLPLGEVVLHGVDQLAHEARREVDPRDDHARAPRPPRPRGPRARR